MTSYGVYFGLDLGPIFALQGLMLLSYAIYFYKCLGSTLHTGERRIVKFALSNVFEEGNRGTLYINGRQVVPGVVRILEGYVLIVAFLMAALAWDIFLIDETYTCDPGLDCFTVNGKPINCSALYDPASNTHINGSGNPDVVCFMFAFNYGLAASAIGGLVTFARGVMSLIAFISIWINDRLRDKYTPFRATVLMMLLQVASMVLVTIFLLATTVVQVIQNPLKFARIHSFLQFFTVLTTAFFALFVPWYKLPREYEQLKS